MGGARAEIGQRGSMLWCAVTFMTGESIPRMILIEVHHHVVTSDLSDHGGGGDGERARVSSGQHGLGEGDIWQWKMVDQQVFGQLP